MSGKTPDGVTIPLLATEAATTAMLAEAAAVTGQEGTTTPTTRTFTEEDMANARRQEKDKLYPKLSELEERLKLFEAERDTALSEAQARAQAEAEARREREEAEMSAKELVARKEDEWKATFNTAQQEWEQKFNALQQESEARQALLERERQFQELESYKSRRIAENTENIIPQLLSTIRGDSVEEIDSSISSAVEISAAIMADIQQSLPQTQQRPRGISPAGSTPSGPLENATEQQVLTTADIANMSMQQYAQYRDRLLAQASGRGR